MKILVVSIAKGCVTFLKFFRLTTLNYWVSPWEFVYVQLWKFCENSKLWNLWFVNPSLIDEEVLLVNDIHATWIVAFTSVLRFLSLDLQKSDWLRNYNLQSESYNLLPKWKGKTFFRFSGALVFLTWQLTKYRLSRKSGRKVIEKIYHSILYQN